MKGVLVALAAVFFTSCAQVATVRNIEPRAPSTASISAHSFPTEREARQDPEAALSEDVEIAARAWADLTRDPSDDRAIEYTTIPWAESYSCTSQRESYPAPEL